MKNNDYIEKYLLEKEKRLMLRTLVAILTSGTTNQLGAKFLKVFDILGGKGDTDLRIGETRTTFRLERGDHEKERIYCLSRQGFGSWRG
ncbi:unnamed protein product [Dovyalis caffra]|uniref:Uncharacterized protein n=1 Tax=Dovyalis caffra TaxID=77055 RepID=A0AAV1R4Y7_9ROSI|nr:unnamed protein product [Dovyalis caffra]